MRLMEDNRKAFAQCFVEKITWPIRKLSKEKLKKKRLKKGVGKMAADSPKILKGEDQNENQKFSLFLRAF